MLTSFFSWVLSPRKGRITLYLYGVLLYFVSNAVI